VAVFGGTVTDEGDRPVGNAELRLRQESGTALEPLLVYPRVVRSDGRGEFLFGGVEPGRYHLRVRSEGRADVHLELTLKGGESDGYRLRLVDRGDVADLPIAIRGLDEGPLPLTLVCLRGLDEQHVWRSVHFGSRNDEWAEIHRAGVGLAVLFPHLPRGRYELSVLGMDGLRYEPSSITLDFARLAQGVVLQAAAPPGRHELRFDLRDGGTGEPLSGGGVRFSSPTWWSEEPRPLAGGGLAGVLADDLPTPDWMIVREGYRPAWGTFAPPADSRGPRIEEVPLSPGWGCELIFRDGGERLPPPSADSWERSAAVHMARPLEGVRVLGDGRLLGRSDGLGRLRLELPQRPARLVFELEGWRELPAPCTGFFDAHDTAQLARRGAAVVWLERSAGP